MATSQRAKELAHQVDYLQGVVDELHADVENYIVHTNSQSKHIEDLSVRNVRLRRFITDNIEKGNQ